jgi:hypothetical protein
LAVSPEPEHHDRAQLIVAKAVTTCELQVSKGLTRAAGRGELVNRILGILIFGIGDFALPH